MMGLDELVTWSRSQARIFEREAEAAEGYAPPEMIQQTTTMLRGRAEIHSQIADHLETYARMI